MAESGTVLVTTQHLESAVPLRDAFQKEGFAVELLTPGERIADIPDPLLLVITGGLDDKQARRLRREASQHDHLPVIALLDSAADAAAHPPWADITTVFIKPIEPTEVALAGKRLIQRRRLREVTGIIGETDPMIEALERVIQIAPVSSTVLVTGESGTGKERVARGIHALSPRRHRPFIAASVAALPETLLESELFGHEKGAFTGAIGQRKGFFELAHRGTLFLDEIGELPVSTQTKLLRVLEERSFMRVGGEQEISVDVRVIAASNQELRQLVEIGHFRRDLYFRLNVLSIHLPPLRERRHDVPLLVEHFSREAAREHARPPVTVSQEALRILMAYDWPGNVRELKNLIESMVVLSPGDVIRPEHIPAEIRDGSRARNLLPVPIPRVTTGENGPLTPELEFIFRTLIQLRVDMEELRRRFDEYRATRPEIGPTSFGVPWPLSLPGTPIGTAIEDVEVTERDLQEEHEVVVYKPGMTLKDLEAAAITAALREVGGNRRKAAEMLDMGERTLYRKIKEYGIPF